MLSDHEEVFALSACIGVSWLCHGSMLARGSWLSLLAVVRGIFLVGTVCWVLRFLLGLVLCLVQWFLPCRFSWASHCLWVCSLLWGGCVSVLWPTCLFCQGMGWGGPTCLLAWDRHSLALAPRSRHPGWGRTYSCVWDQSALGVFRS